MVAIGMVMVARPRLLLVDEPLLGLSPSVQQEVVRALQNISREGITILVAEQFARPLLPVVGRGYIIESGGLVVAGSRDELLQNPEVRAGYFGVEAVPGWRNNSTPWTRPSATPRPAMPTSQP